MIEGIGASLIGSYAIKKAILKELLGECLTNENGENYTQINSVSKKTYIMVLIGCPLVFTLGLIVSFFTDDAGLAQMFRGAFVFGMAMMALSFFILKNSMGTTWTLKKDGLEVKTKSETKLYPYELIKESSLAWPVIQYRNDLIIMAGNEMIKFPYVNNTGGVDFVVKLGNVSGIEVLDTKLIAETVLGTAKRNRQEEDNAFIKRNALVK